MDEKYKGMGFSAGELLKNEDFWKNEEDLNIQPTINIERLEQQIKLRVDEALTAEDFVIDEAGIEFLLQANPRFEFKTVEDVREYLNSWNNSPLIAKGRVLSEEDAISLRFITERATHIIGQVEQFNCRIAG